LNSHFFGCFGRYSFNSDIHQEQIEIMGHNSGFETGLVATKLIKKVAISSSVSFERAYNKPNMSILLLRVTAPPIIRYLSVN
jgi:hypothetical protein